MKQQGKGRDGGKMNVVGVGIRETDRGRRET